jgi:hypothetical protein
MVQNQNDNENLSYKVGQGILTEDGGSVQLASLH